MLAINIQRQQSSLTPLLIRICFHRFSFICYLNKYPSIGNKVNKNEFYFSTHMFEYCIAVTVFQWLEPDTVTEKLKEKKRNKKIMMSRKMSES